MNRQSMPANVGSNDGLGPNAQDYARDVFELLMTDGGAWPRVVERYSNGGYRLMQTASSWSIWCAAIGHRKQVVEAAKTALAALVCHAEAYPHMQKGYTVDAIEALKVALGPTK